MTRAISDAAKCLLATSSNLSKAAENLNSGNSTFGKWAIPDLLPQQGTAVIYGRTGSGKTFFSLHLALSKAAGMPWFGVPLQSGTVVYLVTEDRPGVEARAVAAARHMELVLEDMPFAFVKPFAIHIDDWAANLIEALRAIQTRYARPITAVFLDTLGASFGGRSQDDAAQMTLATDAMQAVAEHFKCVFVAVHHSGKDETRGMRGSQVLKDRVDTVITLGKAKGGSIGINIEKQRNGAPGAPLACRLESADIAVGPSHIESTCIVTDLAIVRASSHAIARVELRPSKLSGDERAVLKAVKSVSEPITIQEFGILTKRTLIDYKSRKDGAVRTAVSHVKQQLLAKKFIEFDEKTGIVRICQKVLELDVF